MRRLTRLMPAQLVFSLSPWFYHMAVTVEGLTYGKVSSYRQDVTCVDFESKLGMSDILFASKIAPVTQAVTIQSGSARGGSSSGSTLRQVGVDNRVF
jgi:hypothetical protein